MRRRLSDIPHIVILRRRKEGPVEECASCLYDNRGQIPLTWGSPSSAIAPVRAFQHDESPYDFFSEDCPPQSPTIMAQYRKGLKNILQKHPNDVVFLSAFRTPITRSYKGGLRNCYPEQMLAAVRSNFATLSSPPTHRLPGPPRNAHAEPQCPTLRRPRCRRWNRSLRTRRLQSCPYGPESRRLLI